MITSLKTAGDRTDFYIKMAWAGTALTLLHLLLLALGGNDFFYGFTVGGLIVALGTLLRRKLRDEYVEQLWAAGTTAAFVVTVLAFLARPFLEGAFGFLTGAPYEFDLGTYAAPIAIAAFFIAFHAAHIRGGA